MEMKYYIGHSNQQDIRYRAASGGIGTALIKYLMESGRYGTSMTFVFDVQESRYKPKLIYSYSEYNNCGSIYQDTDNVGFIKSHLKDIRNGIVVTCLPCQVSPIKNILDKNGVKSFIITLFCSGQTTVEGTWYYYKLLGIDKRDVCNIQYRGNGWPSGIQITMNNGSIIKKDNYTHPWTLMHKSLLFRPRRCLYCRIISSPLSDITLADPWLKEYVETDTIGNTIIVGQKEGCDVLDQMTEEGLLTLKKTDEKTYLQSQLVNIKYKQDSIRHKSFNKLVEKMGREKSFYKTVVTSSGFLLKYHVKLLGMLRKRM